MAFDCFIKIDDIPGESTQSKHKGEIEVLSFSWGVKNTTSGAPGGGGGSGKAQVTDFSFLKEVGSASPALFVAVCAGDHIKQATFTASAPTARRGQVFYKVVFTDVLISSVAPGVQNGDPVPTEQVSLNFAKVEIEFQDERGSQKVSSCDFQKGTTD